MLDGGHFAVTQERGAFLAAVCAVAATAGCSSLPEAPPGIDRTQLVNDLAARLNHGGDRAYAADYQLRGGPVATIAQAQNPLRLAFTYPGGQYQVTSDGTVECTAKAAGTTGPADNMGNTPGGTMRCVRTAPPSGAPRADSYGPVSSHGMIAPAVAVSLLSAAALDPSATVTQRDTTVGGQHATCVKVGGVHGALTSAFEACVTDDGVLGSFTGQLGETAIDVVLVRYSDTPPENAFDLPAGAQIDDQRPKKS